MSPTSIQAALPWTKAPLIVGAPMRLIASPALAVAISSASGLGFIGAGTDLSSLSRSLAQAGSLIDASNLDELSPTTLPVGFGVICHSASLEIFKSVLSEKDNIARPPAAIWLFAPNQPEDLQDWADTVRVCMPYRTPQIWVQVGSVIEAVESCVACNPDVLVVQGIDAGGHGLTKGAGLIALMPEIHDALQRSYQAGRIARAPALVAAGGIGDGRGAAAAIALGADAVCLGTIYVASTEAEAAEGYKQEIVRATDGGQQTVRTRLYDSLRGTHGWPPRFGGRGVINRSYEDSLKGMNEEENARLYEGTLNNSNGWGPAGRLTTYAGTAVGMVKGVVSARQITEDVRDSCLRQLQRPLSIL